jgi:putative DNA primase/helicase
MDTSEIKRALALRMEALAHELIDAPLTYQRLHELRFGRRQSLSVRIGGAKAGTFADFSGNAKGDAIAFIMHMRQCTTGEALAWAEAWLGNAPRPSLTRWHGAPTAAPEKPPEPPRTLDLARNLWRDAMPPQGTLAEAYLLSRGLALEPGLPIRFHACAWRHKESGPSGPAMIALMTCPKTGEAIGAHVTYIHANGAGKAEGGRAKIMLGQAGIIRLSPDDTVTSGLGVAEGVETGLAIMQSFGWRPVWCAASAGGIARFPVLPGIKALTIFADQDSAGIESARICAGRWKEAGREARILAPPKGDFDDLAKAVAA